MRFGIISAACLCISSVATAQAASFSITPDHLKIQVWNKAHTGSWIYNASGFAAKMNHVFNMDTMEMETQTLTGQWIPTAGENTRSYKVAVGVLMKTFAETDWSAVFVIDRATGNKTLVKLPWKGVYAADGSTAPFRGINRIYYTAEGYLNVEHGDASGTRVRMRFNPNLTYRDCLTLTSGEGSNMCQDYQ